MKLCYVYDRKIPKSDNLINGIDRKVLSQIKCFESEGWQCDLVSPERSGAITSLLQILPFFPDRTIWSSVAHIEADIFYIRRPVYCSRQFIQIMLVLRDKNPSAIFLYEVPTFPYDEELNTVRYRAILAKDRWHRRNIALFADAVVDLSGTDCIFGLPTIQIINGVDLDEVKPRASNKSSKRTLDMICVASFARWHGIDRIIKGLAAYYAKSKTRVVRLHLVGNGPESKKLTELTQELNLTESVLFYGSCDRQQMDKVYDRCDIAIASLGLHRINLNGASTLKTREYLAKGIPFVYSGEMDVFRNDPVNFCMKVPSDESSICIENVADFVDDLLEQESVQKLTKRIRLYAEHHVGIKTAMSNVVRYIKKHTAS